MSHGRLWPQRTVRVEVAGSRSRTERAEAIRALGGVSCSGAQWPLVEVRQETAPRSAVGGSGGVQARGRQSEHLSGITSARRGLATVGQTVLRP